MISDKAKTCPKCGAPNIPESNLPEEETTYQNEESPQTQPEETEYDSASGADYNPDPDNYDWEPEPPKSRRKLFVLIIFICAVIVGAVGYFFFSKHQKEKAAQAEADRIEQLRQDSIAAAEREAARLDSIRQDSINRRNFTTPDLAFNDLHGDVKSCVETVQYSYYSPDFSNNNTYSSSFSYDEDGNWTNPPAWTEQDKKIYAGFPQLKHAKTMRDKEGKIIRIYNDPEYDYEYDSYQWENGKLKKDKKSTYNEEGFLVSSPLDIPDVGDWSYLSTICNYVVDGMGNWISREVITKEINQWGDGSTMGFTVNKEKRKITYYKSVSGEERKIPNNAKQEKALKEYRAFKR